MQQGKNAKKGEVGGLRNFCHLFQRPSPPFSRCVVQVTARSSFLNRYPRSSSCSFCIMSSFRSQASRYPHHPHHRPNFASKQPPTPTSPPPPLGELLQTIDVDHLDEPSKDFSHSATISNVRTVASYSWVDKKGLDAESTILIPGAFPPPPQESLTHLADS